MATLMAPDAANKILHTGDHGNVVQYVYEASLSGVNNADVIRFGKIPAGIRVTDVRLKAADTGTGNTASLGYSPADGASPAAVANYWFSAVDTATAAIDSRSTADPIRFERDVWLDLLVGGANYTGSPKITIVVTGINEGVK